MLSTVAAALEGERRGGDMDILAFLTSYSQPSSGII